MSIWNGICSITWDYWSWATAVGPVFYSFALFWAVVLFFFMRKHVHGLMTVVVWYGIHQLTAKHGMPVITTDVIHKQGILAFNLALLTSMSLWSWMNFLVMFKTPIAYRKISWWTLNSGWLIFFAAFGFALNSSTKDAKKYQANFRSST